MGHHPNSLKNLTSKFRFKKGQKPWNTGKSWGEDVKLKMSSSHKGKNLSEEHKKKIGLAGVGRVVSKETRDKISRGNKGRKYSDEYRKKMSERAKGRPGYNKGKHWKLSEETKEKMRLRVGEKSSRWIKDRTKLKKSEKKHQEISYIYWMKNVKIRDSWKCRLLSDECRGRLEAHHIFNWIEYPELRYVINNGITLCHFHHPRGREKEKRMIPIFQELLSVSKEIN